MINRVGTIALLFLAACASNGLAAEPACQSCHTDVMERGHLHPLEGALPGAPGCTDCHRNPAGHPGAGSSMLTFAIEPVGARTAACLDCHQSSHPATGSSLHQQAGVACDGCHASHAGSDAAPAAMPAGFHDLDPASATCVGCHEGTFAQFAFNERHRLAEGSVSCVSCHEPHEDRRRSLIGHADDSPCVACHRDAAGPFVFEHAASRVDGCSACHDPHGSPNRHLLTHQQVGELCYTCHAVVPQFHIGFAPGAPARFGQDSVCTNCHVAIHGSNFDRNYLR